MSEKSSLSRRSFLKATGIVAGAAAMGGGAFALKANAKGANPSYESSGGGHSTASSGSPRGRIFFTNDLEFATISEAAERIFPKDDTGPGAKELSVPYFIDNQLAGAYGYNAREYTQGPFAAGAPTQGYQTPLLRKDIFLQGIAALNTQSEASFKKTFPELDDTQKDQVLKMCEESKIATAGFTSGYFFLLLKNIVLAGVYSDPIYGGNNGMGGWKMKNYPGAQMAYTDVVTQEKFAVIEPLSLADMQH